MKVTVCFGNVRVVVPCGNGDILVRDLIRESTLRFKKATGKGPASWVSVHNLQSQGGGILDPDDKLCDVVDDREQILATFEDGDGSHHGGGDGASGSSVGTGSPDIFHDGDKYHSYPQTDIEVTGEQIASGVPGSLQVRRGSEPALNQLPLGPPLPTSDNTKRWSAAPLISDPPPTLSYNGKYVEDEENIGSFKRIQRDGSNRLSMQFFEDGAGYRWAEAADRAKTRIHTSTSLPREHKRKEPLGQANNSTSPIPSIDQSELIIIRNEPGPLGIHVVPDYDLYGKDRGLLVQGIEPEGRIDRDGRLAINDRIIEINGQNLLNMPFQRVQDMFKLSLTSPELRLKVYKNGVMSSGLKKQPSFPKFPEEKENAMVEFEEKHTQNTKVATVSPTKKVPAGSKNLKSLLSANTRKIGRKIEIELMKGSHGLGFSITTRDNPAGGNCPIYIKNILPKGAAVDDSRLKIGDRLLEVNGVEMTGKSQSDAVQILRDAPPGSKVKIVVSRQEHVIDNDNNELPRIIESEAQISNGDVEVTSRSSDTPPIIPPLPQSHLQALQNRTHPERGVNVAKIISQFQETQPTNNPPEKMDDSMIFPWKHREVLTFNIPVHDTEKAGLGISVKGKTSGNQDLGIFIKGVINGGAASRDGRLQTNDQLLNVNGISLLQQSNSDAMETLRQAMLHTEGPVPGNITLTIARRAPSPSVNRNYSINNSNPNLLNSNEENETFQNSENSDPSSIGNNSGASGSSTNTVIYNPYRENAQNQNLSPIQNWNPVIDRLVGNNNKNSQLRNESYYKATHDTWSSSMLTNSPSFDNTTTTVTVNGGEPILIEDEYGSRVLNQHNTRINVHMTNKLNLVNGNNVSENRNDHEPDGKASLSSTNYDNKSTESSQTTVNGTDATYASQLSLENPQGFTRDAFGRQSMSEKRHATLDAKNTDTYQRTKKLREERIKGKDNADKLGQLGPSLGMKKSSSLESLQTMVQEIQMQEESDPAYSYRGPSGALKVIRGRGCEESFRAAVDDRIVDPNHRSEISAKKHWLLDPPTEEKEVEGFNNVRGGPRQSSLNAALDNKHKVPKKKPGILKGIGSMFRFGKHRKMDFPNVDAHYHRSSEFDNVPQNQLTEESEDRLSHSSLNQQQNESQQSEKSIEQDKILQSPSQQQQIVRQQQQQQQGNSQHRDNQPLYQRHGYIHRHAEQVQVIPENSVPPPIKYRNSNGEVQRRSDRKLHEHRQAMRHSYYPDDRIENHYDNRQQRTEPTYGEYGRPGSRTAVTESVPFTHYVNYNELQSHLSRKQHQYHSQRQTKMDNQLRPMSNFYEYESVQSILNSRGRNNAPSQHYIKQSSNQHYQESNPLSRNQQQGHLLSRGSHRGPFVTQVTIGEQNGTKV